MRCAERSPAAATLNLFASPSSYALDGPSARLRRNNHIRSSDQARSAVRALEAWIRCYPGSQARPTQRKRLEAALHTYLSVKEYENMLWTIFIILLVLWALGLATSYTMGGLIHILLVIAVVVLAIRLFQGRSIA
jgi:hypothetical protein